VTRKETVTDVRDLIDRELLRLIRAAANRKSTDRAEWRLGMLLARLEIAARRVP